MYARTLTTLIVASLTMLCCGRALATSMHPFTLDELAYVADRVVVGEVLSVEAAYTPDGGLIVTHVEVGVQETLKGPADDIVTAWVLGGTVGERTLSVEGTPSFTEGEKVLLFLEQDDHGLSVLGWAQGKYGMSWDESRGDWMLSRPLPAADDGSLKGLSGPQSLTAMRAALTPRLGIVPAYREIPGLLVHKRAAFRTHWNLPEEVQP